MRHVALTVFIILAIFLIENCNHGLSPSKTNKTNPGNLTGISGAIIYEEQNWPPPDSLKNLRLIAFRKFPDPDSIFIEIIQGTAVVYPPIDTSANLRFNVSFQEYVMELPPGRFDYIVVAQQYGDNLFNDWQAVGQYDTDTDSLPSPVNVIQDSLLEDINIKVDFKNLPIQPFEN